jgi:hypothetical protein
MDDNHSKRKEGVKEMSKDNCDLKDIGRWLLNILYDIMDCDCKKCKQL